MLWLPLLLRLLLTLLLMLSDLAMELVTPLLIPLPMRLLRSTPTRSPPTPTSTPWLTTTPEPVSTLRSLTMALPPGRATTLSVCLMAGSSMLTTTPTTSMDTSPRSPTMARPSSLTLLPHLLPTPSLVLFSPTLLPVLLWSVLATASPTVVLLAMALELPTEELPTSAEPKSEDVQDTRETTHADRGQPHATIKRQLTTFNDIFIYLSININTPDQ